MYSMWNTKIYAYEIKGSCPFKIRPKVLILKNKAYPREDFFPKFELWKNLKKHLKTKTQGFRGEQYSRLP